MSLTAAARRPNASLCGSVLNPAVASAYQGQGYGRTPMHFSGSAMPGDAIFCGSEPAQACRPFRSTIPVCFFASRKGLFSQSREHPICDGGVPLTDTASLRYGCSCGTVYPMKALRLPSVFFLNNPEKSASASPRVQLMGQGGSARFETVEKSISIVHVVMNIAP